MRACAERGATHFSLLMSTSDWRKTLIEYLVGLI